MCSGCSGNYELEEYLDDMEEIEPVICPDCKGMGSVETAITQHACDRCKGTGVL